MSLPIRARDHPRDEAVGAQGVMHGSVFTKRAGRGSFGQADWAGFVQSAGLTSSLLAWRRTKHRGNVKACSWARTLAGIVAEASFFTGLPSAARGYGVVLRCNRLCSCFLSETREEGISPSCWNCAGPGPKQMRLNLTHQQGACWDRSRGLWKQMLGGSFCG